jgi:ferredoxin
MKIVVDLTICAGHAQCEEVAPEVFRVNDNWLVDVLMESPPESMRETVMEAARRCPVNAITIED